MRATSAGLVISRAAILRSSSRSRRALSASGQVFQSSEFLVDTVIGSARGCHVHLLLYRSVVTIELGAPFEYLKQGKHGVKLRLVIAQRLALESARGLSQCCGGILV